MITNKDLKSCNEQVFSYSAAYQVPFYGREQAILEMEKLNKELKAGEAMVIAQPLGTGKTFLVNYMISTGKLAIPQGANFLVCKNIAVRPESMNSFPGDTLVVDETDIKTPVKKIQKGLENLADYLKSSGKKAIILGDYTLNNPNIAGSIMNRRQLQSFEPIDKAFLRGVLEQRFRHFLKDEISSDFTIDEVLDPALLDYLAPDWMRSANTFRGMFSLLQTVVSNDRFVRYNSNQAYLTVDMFRSMLGSDDDLDLEEEQEDFLKILREYIKEKYPMGNGITAGFTMEELYELQMQIDDSMSIEDFMEEIVYPFATSDILISTGVPGYDEEDGTFVRRPAPYVPSARLLLSINW